jgi:hypothetical protein
MAIRKGPARLFIRVLLLGAPLIVLVALYVVLDPFEVLWPRQSHYGPSHLVPLDRDFVSTEYYLHNPRRSQLDSFIFGNSRSIFYRTFEWARYVHTAAPYHFDASGETLFGIWTKVRFLHKDGRKFRNALIIMDAETLRVTEDSPGHLLRKDPRVAGTSVPAFHYEFFTAFFYPEFFGRYLAYRLTGSVHPWLGDTFQEGPREVRQMPETNDIFPVGMDRRIQTEGEAFFVELAKKYPRDLSRRPPPSAPTIAARQTAMLSEIHSILANDGADVRIVINPLYDRVPLNPDDVAALRNIFGAGRVFDFSGANAFTNDVHHYYEQSHYRVEVARQILEIVYGRLP